MALDFFAGCVGGAAGVIVGHPFDTIKVRLQTQSPTNIKYRGTFHCLTTIVKQESVTGLYKGISSPLFGVAGVNAIIFGVYGALRPYVSGSPGNDTLWAHFAAGSISGAVQSVVASPMELVKTRLQINQDAVGVKKVGPVDVLKGIYHNEGGLVRGVFKGWGITLGREIPGFGVYFASYEAMTRLGEGQVGTLGMLLAGGMAGVISWIVTFPIDVVKTRLQCDDRGKYSGAIDCARKTYLAEGYKAFSRGLVSTVLRAFPTNAATFTVVTWIMRLAGGAPADDIQDCRKYLDELLQETTRLQEKLEDSLRLKVPQYFCGNSLTSCSLASQCAQSAQKHADRTQVYFNFYQSLQQQAAAMAVHETSAVVVAEKTAEEAEEEDVGVENLTNFRDKLLRVRKSNGNMQALQSTCISSSMNTDDNDNDHHEQSRRDLDANAAALQGSGSHTHSTSKLLSSFDENSSERETDVTAITISGLQRENQDSSKSASSPVQGNTMISHVSASLPARSKVPAATSFGNEGLEEITGETDGERYAAEDLNNHDHKALTQQDLTYLSKSLDIPVHILKAAAVRQTPSTLASNKAVPQAVTPTLTRSTTSSRTQAWRKYYKTPAVNLCKCFEDHCVCYL